MRNLEKIFNPRSVALIGATDRIGSVGLGICKNLLEGKEKRTIFFVNPYRKRVLGRKTYPSVTSIKEDINLALVAVPAKIVPKVIKECCEKKVGGIIVISSGFAEIGKTGKILQDKITEMAKRANIPLVGPNCVSGNTPILLENDNHLKYAEIGPFIESLFKRGEQKVVSVSGTDVLNLKGPIKVCSLDVDGSFGMQRITKVMKRYTVNEALKIGVKGGHQLICSGDHPIFVKQGNEIIKKPARDVMTGEKVPVVNKLFFKRRYKGEINLVEEIDKKVPLEIKENVRVKYAGKRYDFSKFIRLGPNENELRKARIYARYGQISLPGILEISDELCKLIAYFVADGNYKEDCLRVGYVKDTQAEKELRRCVNAVFSSSLAESSKAKEFKFGRKIGKIVFRHVFEIGEGAKSKSVPAFIFSTEPSKIVAFLSGLFSGDGGVYSWPDSPKHAIYFHSTSKKLIDQVEFLLNLLGVGPFYTTVKPREKAFVQEKLCDANDLYELRSDSRQVITHLYNLGFRFTIRGKSEKLENIINTIKKRMPSRVKGCFYFREIKSIEKLEHPIDLYDFEVEKTHNFVAGQIVTSNCLGVIRPSIKLNASFAPATPRRGEIAFVSQSGALIDSVIDRSLMENYGFSSLISYGNEADLELPDFLIRLEKDKETKVIAIYLEAIKDGKGFMEAVKRVLGKKPIVVLKAGKTKAGAKAVSTHTAALAGSAEIYSAVFKQSGLFEVETTEELFDAAKALAWQPRCKNGIGIVTNGGGVGVLAADYCERSGIKLPRLNSQTLRTLEKSKTMHPAFSRGNPLDIVGDALADRYKVAVETLLAQKDIYGLIVIQTLQIMTQVLENAKVIIEAKKKFPEKPIICCFMGGKLTAPGIEMLEKNKIPNYSDPKRAVLAMRSLIKR